MAISILSISHLAHPPVRQCSAPPRIGAGMMVTTMTWDKLGTEVRQRRTELGLTQEQVAERGGPSTPTLRTLENNRANRLSPRLRRSLERTLHWATGSVDAILAGHSPTPVEPATIAADGPEFYLLLDHTLTAIRGLTIGASGETNLSWSDDAPQTVRGIRSTFGELELRLTPHHRESLGSLIDLLEDLVKKRL